MLFIFLIINLSIFINTSVTILNPFSLSHFLTGRPYRVEGKRNLFFGDLIFGKKRGKLYRKNNETVTEITGFPEVLSTGVNKNLKMKVHFGYK